jgi:hypothetical protein
MRQRLSGPKVIGVVMHEADDANVFGATRWTVPQPSGCPVIETWQSRLSPFLQLLELCVRRGRMGDASFQSNGMLQANWIAPQEFQKKPGRPHFWRTSGLSELGMRHQQTTAFLGRPANVAKKWTMPRDRHHAFTFGGA